MLHNYLIIIIIAQLSDFYHFKLRSYFFNSNIRSRIMSRDGAVKSPSRLLSAVSDFAKSEKYVQGRKKAHVPKSPSKHKLQYAASVG